MPSLVESFIGRIRLIFFTASREHQERIEFATSFSFVQQGLTDFFQNEEFSIRGFIFDKGENFFSIEDDSTYSPFPIKDLSKYFISYYIDKSDKDNAALLRIVLRFTPLAQKQLLSFRAFSFFALLISIVVWVVNMYLHFFQIDVMNLILIISLVFCLISISISLGDYHRIQSSKKRLFRAIAIIESGKELNYF